MMTVIETEKRKSNKKIVVRECTNEQIWDAIGSYGALVITEDMIYIIEEMSRCKDYIFIIHARKILTRDIRSKDIDMKYAAMSDLKKIGISINENIATARVIELMMLTQPDDIYHIYCTYISHEDIQYILPLIDESISTVIPIVVGKSQINTLSFYLSWDISQLV